MRKLIIISTLAAASILTAALSTPASLAAPSAPSTGGSLSLPPRDIIKVNGELHGTYGPYTQAVAEQQAAQWNYEHGRDSNRPNDYYTAYIYKSNPFSSQYYVRVYHNTR
jgi:hypothetical protein